LTAYLRKENFLVIMTVVTNLPVDIICQVQQYFFSDGDSQTLFSDSASLLFSEAKLSDVQAFYLQESNRSWRNFLNVSKRDHWQFVKKSTMMWSLNTFASRKYLDDLPFRNYINERMTNPGMQLILKIPDLESPKRITSVEQGLTMNTIGFLSLQCSRSGPISMSFRLPSCDSLHTLFLDDCPGIISLGEYKHLKTLKVHRCTNLLSAGKMEKLTTFYGNGIQRSFLQSISSEKLISLTLYSHIAPFLRIINRFQQLRELVLVLDIHTALDFHLPKLFLPFLEKLTAKNYFSIDVTDLYRLKELDIGCTFTSAVKGKEDIFPRLTSLSGSSEAFLGEDIRNYPQLKTFAYQISEHSIQNLFQYENIPEVHLTCKTSTCQLKKFNISRNTKSFTIHLHPADVVVEGWKGRTFERVSLSSATLRNLSVFHNVQRLSLVKCSELVNISAARNIPYLSFEKCPKIADFSYLGLKQRFLSIIECPGLKDVDFHRFGKIYHLTIKSCQNVSRIDGLVNNRFISISDCLNLSDVLLNGVNYTKVSIHRCDCLSNFAVTKVYSLRISCCKKLDKNCLQNYEYFEI
jgi:hypothetical protein